MLGLVAGNVQAEDGRKSQLLYGQYLDDKIGDEKGWKRKR